MSEAKRAIAEHATAILNVLKDEREFDAGVHTIRWGQLTITCCAKIKTRTVYVMATEHYSMQFTVGPRGIRVGQVVKR